MRRCASPPHLFPSQAETLVENHDPAEVIRALCAEPGPAPVPILILSGEPISRSELKTLGADGAVQKPFDIPALIAQIRGHLGADRDPR